MQGFQLFSRNVSMSHYTSAVTASQRLFYYTLSVKQLRDLSLNGDITAASVVTLQSDSHVISEVQCNRKDEEIQVIQTVCAAPYISVCLCAVLCRWRCSTCSSCAASSCQRSSTWSTARTVPGKAAPRWTTLWCWSSTGWTT